MAKRDHVLLDQTRDDADERAMREGEADADTGRVVSHADFSQWLATWGTPGEQPPPKEWLT